MIEDKLLTKDLNVKKLAYGMMAYTAGSILGPLVLFGGGGYIIDIYLETRPFGLIGGVLMAFVLTNILILKKVNKLSKKLNNINPEKEEKNKAE